MIFLYLILLIISVFFYILYEGVISLMLFTALCVMPFIMLALNLYVRTRVSVDVNIDARSCTAGQSIPVKIHINNRSIIPIPCAEIVMEYTVSSSNKSEQIRINTPVFPNNVQTLSTHFSCSHFGMAGCRVAGVKLFDMLRLTRLRLSKKRITQQNTEVMILPEALELDNAVSDYSDLGLESDIYSPDKPGDDPSEIFALREYADGDKMARIHWKLTAKTDRLMVKDYSLPLADSFLILTDTYIPNSAKDGEDIYDMLITLTFSLSSLLREKEKRHRLAFYSEAAEELSEMPVTDDQTLLDASAALLMSGTSRQADLAAAALAADDSPVRHYGHLILVCAHISEKTSEAILSSGLANRYTALLCCTDKQSAAAAVADIDIITVQRDDIGQSIAELIL